MKHRSVLTGILIGVACIFCFHNVSAAQQVKRARSVSTYTFAFRPISLTGKRRRLMLEVRGIHVHKDYGHTIMDALEISVLSLQNGRRKVMSKKRLDGDFYWFEASLYRHHKSGDYLLALQANGGQHDHTQVYYLSPRDLQPHLLTEESGVIYGDPSGLSEGRLVEHSPDQYVAENEKPVGFQRRKPEEAEYMTRCLRYQPKTHRFLAGAYRREKGSAKRTIFGSSNLLGSSDKTSRN